MIGIPVIDLTKPKGIWLDCAKCLYGNVYNCPTGVTMLCSVALGWDFSYRGYDLWDMRKSIMEYEGEEE